MKNLTEKDYGRVLHESLRNVQPEEIPEILKRFVSLIAKKGMLGKYRKIEREYTKLYNTENKISEVTVTLQERLTLDKKQTLISKLKEWLGAQDIILTEKVDQRIIGGIKIATDGMVYDGTLSRKLEELKKQLTY